MHCIHCGGAVFPYQALERRQAQETLIGCAGLHKRKFQDIKHSPCFNREAQVPVRGYIKIKSTLRIKAISY
jgi:hypothetical protein